MGSGCLPEDAFSNKRVLPGPPPRTAMSEDWTKRLQVTTESFDLSIQYFIAAAERGTSKNKLGNVVLKRAHNWLPWSSRWRRT